MKLIIYKIGFFTAFIIPTLVITGFYARGYWNFITVLFSFLMMPLIDQAIGVDTSNTEPEVAKHRAEEFYYRFVTYCWTYFQMAFVIWGCYAVSSGMLHNT